MPFGCLFVEKIKIPHLIAMKSLTNSENPSVNPLTKLVLQNVQKATCDSENCLKPAIICIMATIGQ
jgi:hypothetical protein